VRRQGGKAVSPLKVKAPSPHTAKVRIVSYADTGMRENSRQLRVLEQTGKESLDLRA
jgi:hypothetical protein